MDFQLNSGYKPAGDQGQAIDKISAGIDAGQRYQTLRGVTGSGKTFTMAKIIERTQKPALVLSHNKTLAAQLYREFKDFFPRNAVEYFVSYYDYYQPEAYVAKRDLYIEKDSSINDEIERLRNSATVSLMERGDTIVVATVSCIYGLGDPTAYKDMRVHFAHGQELDLAQLKRDLVRMQYTRNSDYLDRSMFRLRGDLLEIYPAYTDKIYAITLEWDEVRGICTRHPVSGDVIDVLDELTVYPAKHFVVPEENMGAAVQDIRGELAARVRYYKEKQKSVEAQRLESRTLYDLEMIEELGYCKGIENYSRHIGRRGAGERPAVLLDYFPEDYITFVDESHVTLPQLRGMYAGDRARKENLVEYGFRLPSALDNRPLYYDEFDQLSARLVYVSATPKEEEYQRSAQVVDQIIRPTGLVDPTVEVRGTAGQIDYLYERIRKCVDGGDRVLITTLTKKLAEQLAEFLSGMGVRACYIHSELDTIERVEILTNLRAGEHDVLVGINLLREGLDLPEVALIAIMDADKIGFLRSATSLIQTIGRAARNVNGAVIMFADTVSDAMREAIGETNRRRALQEAYNQKHGITPQSIRKNIQAILVRTNEQKRDEEELNVDIIKDKYNITNPAERRRLLRELQGVMDEHAKNWDFEKAAVVRDEIREIESAGTGAGAAARAGAVK